MVEGLESLDRVTIAGDEAGIETIQAFVGPTGVTITGGRTWGSKGQLAYIFYRSGKTAKPESFQPHLVPVPAN